MKELALVFTLRFRGQLVFSKVLGDGDSYDREISVKYPTTVTLPPAAPDWESKVVPTFTLAELKEAISGYGPNLRQELLGRFADDKAYLWFSESAQHLPSIGDLRAEMVSIEIDIPDQV